MTKSEAPSRRTLAGRNLRLAGRLSDVSVVLVPGEITAICGPNGAGKSSLLQCLAGLISPERGGLTVDGVDLSALHPRERAKIIGYLPQDPEVAWDVAVRSLVALGRLPHRDRGAEQVDAAMKSFRVFARKVPGSDGNYSMDHSAVVYLMDKQGRFATAFNLQQPAKDAAAQLARYL